LEKLSWTHPLWLAKDSTAILDPGLSLLWGILEQELVQNLGFLERWERLGLPMRSSVNGWGWNMCHLGVRRSWFLGGG